MKINEGVIDVLATLVAHDNCTYLEAGQRLGMSESQIYKITRTPLFRRARNDRLRQRANAHASKMIAAEGRAIDVLTELMDHETPSVRADAAKAILANVPRIKEAMMADDAAARRETEDIRHRINHREAYAICSVIPPVDDGADRTIE